jgi:hypothetical protein
MPHIICEVSAGLRDSERTVAVRDINGRRQFLRVEQGFVTHRNGKTYLPVGIVSETLDGKVLIELSHEADSGANRLWVQRSDLLASTEAPA